MRKMAHSNQKYPGGMPKHIVAPGNNETKAKQEIGTLYFF
jgi:hypothetical protein